MKLKRIASHASPIIAIAAAVFVLAVSASMLSNLRHALGARRHREQRPTDSEDGRIRRALAPMLMEIDHAAWEREFGRLPADFDYETFRKSLPVLDPPLSQTIVDQRDEDMGD